MNKAILVKYNQKVNCNQFKFVLFTLINLTNRIIILVGVLKILKLRIILKKLTKI